MSDYDWHTIQLRWEAGEPANRISQSMGGHPRKQTILEHASRHGWTRNDGPIESLPIPLDYWETLSEPQKAAIEAFALGVTTFEDAALRAAVDPSTLRRWRKDEQFARLCQLAKSRFRDEMVQGIKDHGGRDWRANAWLLERTNRQEFGQNVQVMQGNTFNILGNVKLGIPREEHNVIDVSPGEDPASKA